GTISWTVADNGTTAGAADAKSVSDSLSITVTEVNDAPTRTSAAATAVSVAEDSANGTAASLGLSSLTYSKGPANESSQTLTVTVTAIPSFVTLWNGSTQVSANDTLTVAELQGLTYKTVADANGTGTISWTVSDNGTTAGSADAKSVSDSLSITVTEVNDAPTRTSAAATAVSVAEDSANGTAASLGLSSLTY